MKKPRMTAATKDTARKIVLLIFAAIAIACGVRGQRVELAPSPSPVPMVTLTGPTCLQMATHEIPDGNGSLYLSNIYSGGGAAMTLQRDVPTHVTFSGGAGGPWLTVRRIKPPNDRYAPENVQIESTAEPIVARAGEKWLITFAERIGR